MPPENDRLRAENEPPTATQSVTGQPALFATPPPERAGFPVAWIIAGVAVVLVILGLVLFSRHSAPPANAALPPAAAAKQLTLSGIVMSEGISVSGGKYTYIDGQIKNTGTSTVTDLTAQTFFANDAGSAPQIETTPLNLIRTRKPYVDVEPVSAEPLKPGETHDFRLIFEGISPSWNQQIPEIRLVSVTTR